MVSIASQEIPPACGEDAGAPEREIAESLAEAYQDGYDDGMEAALKLLQAMGRLASSPDGAPGMAS